MLVLLIGNGNQLKLPTEGPSVAFGGGPSPLFIVELMLGKGSPLYCTEYSYSNRRGVMRVIRKARSEKRKVQPK